MKNSELKGLDPPLIPSKFQFLFASEPRLILAGPSTRVLSNVTGSTASRANTSSYKTY
jgi:hypothetical protein